MNGNQRKSDEIRGNQRKLKEIWLRYRVYVLARLAHRRDTAARNKGNQWKVKESKGK